MRSAKPRRNRPEPMSIFERKEDIPVTWLISLWRRYACLLVYASVATLAACNSDPLSGKVTIDGSATVFPLNQAMAKAFRESNPAVQFAVEFSGTGGGFRKFCADQVDISAASRPIKSAEGERCKAQHIEYIEVPIAFDSLAVVVNA